MGIKKVVATARLAIKAVQIDLEGGTEVVRLRELTAGQRLELFERYNNAKGDAKQMADAQAWLIACSALDDDADALAFDSSSATDLATISLLPSSIQDKLIRAIQEVSGFAEKAAEDAEKN